MLKQDPYQKAGSLWLASGGNRGLGDDPGLGKTNQCIVASKLIGADRIAVISPPIVIPNWAREFKSWREDHARLNVRLVSFYDSQKADTIGRLKPDVLVIDEAHRLKTYNSQRTCAIYGNNCDGSGIIRSAGRVWVLSGTFIPNGNPMEVWPHLRALRPDLVDGMTRHQFMNHYCYWSPSVYGPRVHGVKNKSELRDKLKQFILRRGVDEVSLDLPPILWEHSTVDSGLSESVIRGMDSPEAEAITQHYAETGNWRAYESELSGVGMAQVRRVIGEVKSSHVARAIAEELESYKHKRVLFCHHHAALNALHGALTDFNPVQLSGQSTPKQKREALEKFSTDPSCLVFLGQMDACGEGINELVAANYVDFVEGTWNPNVLWQAVKRLARRGQSKTVIARVWGLQHSIDDVVAGVNVRKLRNAKELGL